LIARISGGLPARTNVPVLSDPNVLQVIVKPAFYFYLIRFKVTIGNKCKDIDATGDILFANSLLTPPNAAPNVALTEKEQSV